MGMHSTHTDDDVVHGLVHWFGDQLTFIVSADIPLLYILFMTFPAVGHLHSFGQLCAYLLVIVGSIHIMFPFARFHFG